MLLVPVLDFRSQNSPICTHFHPLFAVIKKSPKSKLVFDFSFLRYKPVLLEIWYACKWVDFLVTFDFYEFF